MVMAQLQPQLVLIISFIKKIQLYIDKCLFKVDTDTGNLKEFFHNWLNFEKNSKTTRFQLEKNWKNFLHPGFYFFLIKEYSFTLIY